MFGYILILYIQVFFLPNGVLPQQLNPRLTSNGKPGILFVYRGLVARGPAGSAIKRIADEAILSDFGGMFSSFTHHYSVK